MRLIQKRESILDLVEQYQIEQIRYYINQKMARINERRKITRDTPLHLAARKGRLDIVKLLIKAGARINAANRDRHLPLHVAALAGKTEVVNLLLAAGSRRNGKDKLNKDSPLHLACRKGHNAIVRLLIAANAKVNQQNKQRSTPLHLACIKGSLPAVENLISAGATIDAEDESGETALHKAARGGFTHIVRLLLRNDADPNSFCDRKETPLHRAAERGFIDIAALLLEYDANHKFKNYLFKRPVDLALLQDRNPVVLILGGGESPENYYQRVHHFIEQFEQLEYKEFLALHNKALFEHRAELVKKRWAIRHYVQTYLVDCNDGLPFEMFLDLLFKPEALLVRVEAGKGLYLFSRKEERAYRLKPVAVPADPAAIHLHSELPHNA